MEIAFGIAAGLTGLVLALLARAGERRAQREAAEAREAKARAEADVAQLNARLADKEAEVGRAGAGRERFESVEKALATVKTTVEQVQSHYREREESVAKHLEASRKQDERLSRNIERLAGRFGNPKQRGTLAEDWLVVALENYDLRKGVHFTVQQATRLGPGAEGSRALLDVYLKLPDGGGIALDAKFPWSEQHARLDVADEDERGAILTDLAGRLREHIKQLASREYTEAADVKVGAVWMIVPDWYSLVLAREADPELPEFARSRGINVIPVEGLAEVAGSMLLAHQLRDWSERVEGAFTPKQAQEKLDALMELVEKLGEVAKKYNSLGAAIDKTFASFSPGGKVTRHVIRPTEDLADRDPAELGIPELHHIDEGKAPTLAERLEQGRLQIEALIEAEVVELEPGPRTADDERSAESDAA
jgi:DNA recombination protein RmuC